MNSDPLHYQILISGVGGQGVLFVTRLFAEAAIAKGLPVFTSETHGMAQRGGTVISHLKVGDFTSPLIMPGDADGLIALKAESVAQHGDYLRDGGWACVNGPPGLKPSGRIRQRRCDADRLARKIDNSRAVNLIMMGFVLSQAHAHEPSRPRLFCTVDDIIEVITRRLEGKAALLQASLRALQEGGQSGSD